ncbi:uncharacterized protein LOC120433828 [Oreochromis aureus]|uniref:uncharacterized protein LOC120433828 n=1 Tax=Oreochromis aureus TaxID=47969 RepID=UPI001952E477|nr:uncharacterized protein LOC120433828 [Oreochromis aureus]
MASPNCNTMINNNTALSNPDDSTVQALISLLNSLFSKITSEQWDKLLLGYPDSFTAELLLGFVQDTLQLCEVSQGVPLRSSQNYPMHEDSSVHTTTSKTVINNNTALSNPDDSTVQALNSLLNTLFSKITSEQWDKLLLAYPDSFTAELLLGFVQDTLQLCEVSQGVPLRSSQNYPMHEDSSVHTTTSKTVINNNTALSNPDDSTVQALNSLLNTLFSKITSEQWDKLLLAYPDSFTVELLFGFVQDTLQLCEVSQGVPLRSSQNYPMHEDSSVHTTTSKTVINSNTALSNLDDSTVQALNSLLNNLNITSEQWDGLSLGYPDSFTTELLLGFVHDTLQLCEVSQGVPLRSSQNYPVHEDSSVHTTTSKTVINNNTALSNPANSTVQALKSRLDNLIIKITSEQWDRLSLGYSDNFTAELLLGFVQDTLQLCDQSANTEESCQNADQHSAANAEINPISDPQQQKSCVEHDASIPSLTDINPPVSCEKTEKHRSSVACEPPKNNPDFEKWLSRLIQAVLSKLGKLSEFPPSHSLQKHLLARILTEIQDMHLHLGPEVKIYFDSIANAIFTDISEKLIVTGDEYLMDLMELDDLILNSVTTSVFQEHLLAVTDIDRLELYQKKETRRFSVENCVEELLLEVVKHAGVVISTKRSEAISTRLTVKVWAELRAEYDKIPLEKLRKLSKEIFKSLCKTWPHAVAILTSLNLKHRQLDEDIIETFKRKLSKEPICKSRCFLSVRAVFGDCMETKKSCVEHEASIPSLTDISQPVSCEKTEKHRSSVACEPPKSNPDFEKWLSILIQAVLSKLGKLSEFPPSHSLQKHLMAQILTEIQEMHLHLGPEVKIYFDSIANAIFTDISEKLIVTGDEYLMDLMELDDLILNSVTTSVFQEHLLAVTDIDRLELYQKKETRRFSVENCVEELLLEVVKHAGVVISTKRSEAISTRLTVKVWAELRAEYDKIPLEKLRKLSKEIFKSLCKTWPHAVAILTSLNLKHRQLDEDIIETFKRKLSKEPICKSRCFLSVRAVFGDRMETKKSCVEHEASIPSLTDIYPPVSCEKTEKHRSSVACEPPKSNPDFEKWLSRLIQAVLSKLGKLSEFPPSHSLQKHLLARILTEIQDMHLHLGPEVQKYFDSIANAIFTDISEKLIVTLDEHSMDLMELGDLILNSVTTSVFQEHLLAVTDIDRLELYQKKETCRFSVENCVEELLLEVVKHAGVVISTKRSEAISTRLTVKVWAELRAEYDKIPLEKFKKLSKRIFKSLCKKWTSAAVILTSLNLNHPKRDDDIVETFKRKLSKEPSYISRFFSSVRVYFGRFMGRNKVSPV